MKAAERFPALAALAAQNFVGSVERGLPDPLHRQAEDALALLDHISTNIDAMMVSIRANSGTRWALCDCGVPIFAQALWSHAGGTPPQDHDAEPLSGSEWREHDS